MISLPKQRQQIQILRKQIGLDEDTYRDILSEYGVKSSLKLNYNDADDLINRLRTKAAELGINKEHNMNCLKYENLKNRPRGMASPAQLRLINVLWKNVSTKETDAEKEQDLNRFLVKITGKRHMHFLEQSDVQKVIKAIKTMQKKDEKE